MKLDLPARPSPTALDVDASGMQHQAGRLSAGFREVSEAYIRSLDLKTRPTPITPSSTKGLVIQGYLLADLRRALLSFVFVALAWNASRFRLDPVISTL